MNVCFPEFSGFLGLFWNVFLKSRGCRGESRQLFLGSGLKIFEKQFAADMRSKCHCQYQWMYCKAKGLMIIYLCGETRVYQLQNKKAEESGVYVKCVTKLQFKLL